jgi:hypothetical protein
MQPATPYPNPASPWVGEFLTRTHDGRRVGIRWLTLLLAPSVILALRIVPGSVGDASYLVTAAYSLLGRRQAVVALLLVSLLNNITHAFAAPPRFAVYTRFLVLFAAGFSVFVVNRRAISRPAFRIQPLVCAGVIGLIMLHSAVLSTMPLLSTLKTASFGVALLTLLVACAGMNSPQRRDLEMQVLGTISIILLLSIPMAFTAAGYYRGFSGLSGTIKHPQAFGVIASVVGVVFCMNILAQRQFHIFTLAMAAVSIGLVFLSKARVGGAVLVGGISAGFMLQLVSAIAIRWRRTPQIRVRRAVPIAVIAVAGLLVCGPAIFTQLRAYALKYNVDSLDTSTTAAMWESRGKLILPMLQNIERHPYRGVGFGVPGEGDKGGQIAYDPIFGLPVMATIEKGFLPIAIFEELGIPLGLVIYAWLLWLVSLSVRGGVISVATCTGALFVNVAECVLFAAGGLGTYLLIFICLAITSSAFNIPGERQSLF